MPYFDLHRFTCYSSQHAKNGWSRRGIISCHEETIFISRCKCCASIEYRIIILLDLSLIYRSMDFFRHTQRRSSLIPETLEGMKEDAAPTATAPAITGNDAAASTTICLNFTHFISYHHNTYLISYQNQPKI